MADRITQTHNALLALHFESEGEEPPAQDLVLVLDDLDGLYRSAPRATRYGVPWEVLLNDYRLTRLQQRARLQATGHLEEFEREFMSDLLRQRFARSPSFR